VTRPVYELVRCVVCGHADAKLVADADAIRREQELVWAYHERRLRSDVPVARLVDRVAFSEPPAFRLVRCRECGLVYRNPAERTHELKEAYTRDAPTRDVLRALHHAQLGAMHGPAGRLRAALGRGGSGLEVGSYVGAFLSAARDSGLNMEGLDVNSDMNDFVRSLGLVAHDGDLETFASDRRFDAIAIWNTFDQLSNPRAAVSAAQGLLQQNGVLAIRVPNGAYYVRHRARLDHPNPIARAAARAVLAQNNLLSFPYRFGFTPISLGRLLTEGGFSVMRVYGDVLVRVADEWTHLWARAEEVVAKRLMSMMARRRPQFAPWFEIYASRLSATDR